METGKIIISDPKDLPYGCLHNDYEYKLLIEDKPYPSVTNYILSNMLLFPQNRIILQNKPITFFETKAGNIEQKVDNYIQNMEKYQGIKINREKNKQLIKQIKNNILKDIQISNMDIRTLYTYLSTEEENQSIFKWLIDSYTAKSEQDPNFSQILLETKNSPIIYVSNNTLLGVQKMQDEKGVEKQLGDNLIGQALMQVRHQIQIENKTTIPDIEKKNYENQVMKIYTVYNIIHRQIGKMVPIAYMLNMSYDEIINDYIRLHPEFENEIKQQYTYENEILEMFYKNRLFIISDEMKSPKSMIRHYVDFQKETQEKNKERAIVDKFISYILKLLYPDILSSGINDVLYQFHYIEDREEYKILSDKILGLYRLGKFKNLTFSEQDSKSDLQDVIENIFSTSYEKSSYESKSKDDIEKAFGEESSQEIPADNNIRVKLIDTLINKIITKEYFKLTKAEKNKKKDELYSIYGKEDIDIETLKDTIEKYDQGYWVVYCKRLKKKDIKVGVIEEPEYPDEATIKKLIEEFNKKAKINIDYNSCRLIWQLKSDRDVQEIKEMPVTKEEKQISAPIYIFSKIDENDPKYVIFNPEFIRDFVLNDQNYPSISIYLIVMLYSTWVQSKDAKGVKRGGSLLRALTSLNLNERYKSGQIQTQSLHELISEYSKFKVSQYKYFYNYYLNKGLAAKFKISYFNQVLLTTDKYGLVIKNDDEPDTTATALEKIRENVRKMYDNTRPEIIEYANIPSFLYQDTFMNKWLMMNINDMLSLSRNLHIYLTNQGLEQSFDKDFIRKIISIFYDRCNAFEDYLVKDINIDIPNYFVDLVTVNSNIDILNPISDIQKFSKEKQDKIEVLDSLKASDPSYQDVKKEVRAISKKIDDIKTDFKIQIEDIAKVIWKRIISMVIYMFRSKKVNAQKIRNNIVKSQYYFATLPFCKDKYFDDNTENCIAAAIINIIQKLNTFKHQYNDSEENKINKNDIDLAFNIIVSKQLYQKKKIKDVSQEKTDNKRNKLIEYEKQQRDKQTEDDEIKQLEELIFREEQVDEQQYQDELQRIQDEQENDELLQNYEVDEQENLDLMENYDDGYDREFDYEEDGGSNMEFRSARFGVKSDENRVNLIDTLRNNNFQIDEETVNYFIKNVTRIQKLKMPYCIKRNRINFFL